MYILNCLVHLSCSHFHCVHVDGQGVFFRRFGGVLGGLVLDNVMDVLLMLGHIL